MLVRFLLLACLFVATARANPIARINSLTEDIQKGLGNPYLLANELMVLCVTGQDFIKIDLQAPKQAIESLSPDYIPRTNLGTTILVRGLAAAAYNLNKVSNFEDDINKFFMKLLDNQGLSQPQREHILLSKDVFWNAWRYFKTGIQPEWSTPSIKQAMDDVNEGKGFQDLLNNLRDYRTNIAVVDNGFDLSNPLLRGRISQKYNAETGSDDVSVSDVNSYHGTHVAGIVAQYNPNGDIYTIKAMFPNVIGFKDKKDSIEAEIRRNNLIVKIFNHISTIPSIKIVNASFGINAHEKKLYAAMRNMVTAHGGKLLVVTAGNIPRIKGKTFFLGDDEITMNLGDLAEETSGRVIIVGSQDDPDTVKSGEYYQAYYISAPGYDVLSGVPESKNETGNIGERTGTSMAAPAIAGVLSSLIQTYGLTVDEARDILFKTARPTQEPEIYGRGLMDANAAMETAAALEIKKKLVFREEKAPQIEAEPPAAMEGDKKE